MWQIEIAGETFGLRYVGEKRIDSSGADAGQHIGAVLVV
jgi:hypothetical protein